MTCPEKTKAPAATEAYENTHLDYLPIGDLVQLNIEGQQLAKDPIEQLQTRFVDPDLLYSTLKTILPATNDIAALTRVRGFMRILQKRIERSVS